MTNTNSELSRLAAERLGNERQLRGTEAFAAKVIADTYAEAVQGRIPCSERLPEIDEPVWAWDGTDMLILVRRLLEEGDEVMDVWCNTYMRVSCRNGVWRADEAHYDADYEPTHWQPLPQPPEATK